MEQHARKSGTGWILLPVFIGLGFTLFCGGWAGRDSSLLVEIFVALPLLAGVVVSWRWFQKSLDDDSNVVREGIVVDKEFIAGYNTPPGLAAFYGASLPRQPDRYVLYLRTRDGRTGAVAVPQEVWANYAINDHYPRP